MQTIEEVWHKYQTVIRASGWGCRCGPEDGVVCVHRTECEDEAEGAARALALAVLAEAACDCDGSHESNCPWLEQESRVRAVYDRIERLGETM